MSAVYIPSPHNRLLLLSDIEQENFGTFKLMLIAIPDANKLYCGFYRRSMEFICVCVTFGLFTERFLSNVCVRVYVMLRPRCCGFVANGYHICVHLCEHKCRR